VYSIITSLAQNFTYITNLPSLLYHSLRYPTVAKLAVPYMLLNTLHFIILKSRTCTFAYFATNTSLSYF